MVVRLLQKQPSIRPEAREVVEKKKRWSDFGSWHRTLGGVAKIPDLN